MQRIPMLTAGCMCLAVVSCATAGSKRSIEKSLLDSEVLHAIAAAFHMQGGIAHTVCLSIDGQSPTKDQLALRSLQFGRELLAAEQCEFVDEYYVVKASALAAMRLVLSDISLGNGRIDALAMWSTNRSETCSEQVSANYVDDRWIVVRAETMSCTVE